MDIQKNIVLIGMPGCGKTTIGKILASKLSLSFVDIDQYIEEKMGASISSIFEEGEMHFRSLELAAVKDIISGLSPSQVCVISTGGGIVVQPESIELLANRGIVFFIDRTLDNIRADLDIQNRPLLKSNPDELFNLYNLRLPLYERYANYKVHNDGCLENVIQNIVCQLNAIDDR